MSFTAGDIIEPLQFFSIVDYPQKLVLKHTIRRKSYYTIHIFDQPTNQQKIALQLWNASLSLI